jgi:hypothetical protein
VCSAGQQTAVQVTKRTIDRQKQVVGVCRVSTSAARGAIARLLGPDRRDIGFRGQPSAAPQIARADVVHEAQPEAHVMRVAGAGGSEKNLAPEVAATTTCELGLIPSITARRCSTPTIKMGRLMHVATCALSTPPQWLTSHMLCPLTAVRSMGPRLQWQQGPHSRVNPGCQEQGRQCRPPSTILLTTLQGAKLRVGPELEISGYVSLSNVDLECGPRRMLA